MVEKPEFRVWWIPQIGMKAEPFEFTVPSLDAGIILCQALADYDLYQFENKVKPDYCNMGGLQWRHSARTDGEWWDVEIDDDDELEDTRKEIEELTRECV